MERVSSDYVLRFYFKILFCCYYHYYFSPFQKCLSLMDRGFVFRLINSHMSHFAAESESRSIQELKFTFLQIVSSHEHFVSFNLPVWLNKSRQGKVVSSRLSRFMNILSLLKYPCGSMQVACSMNDCAKLRKKFLVLKILT